MAMPMGAQSHDGTSESVANGSGASDVAITSPAPGAWRTDEVTMLRASLDRFADGLLILDPELSGDGLPPIRYVNEGFERRTGWTRDLLQGRSLSLLLAAETSPAAWQRIREAIQLQTPLRTELAQATRNGHAIWVDLDLMPMLDANDRLQHWIAITRDLSDHRRLSEQLVHARKMCTIGRLSTELAQDLDGAITQMQSLAEMLCACLPAGSTEFAAAQRILDTATRTSIASRQVLAFSRRQQTVPTEIDLNAVLLELAPLMRRAAGHGVLIRTALEEPLPAVHADPALLEQALIGLVVTAGDALQHRGALTIETAFVQVREEDASLRGGVVPGAQVHLRLLASRELANRRLDDVPIPASTASGTSDTDLSLSLATVREIVRQSGGTMLLGRSVAQGVVYTLSFPAMQGWPATVVPSEPMAVADGTETILLIEDNAAVREVARAMLRRRGYQVLEAQDGAHAAQIASAHTGSIDLVLADVLLPGGSGYEAATALRERHPSLRILLMSGAPDRSVLGLPDTTEPLLWLEKPFTESTLAAHVRLALHSLPTAAP